MKHYCENSVEKNEFSDGEMGDEGTVEVAEVVERWVM